MIDFTHFGIIDIIDILVVGLVVYQLFKIIRRTAAMNIFIGIILLYLVYVLTDKLEMTLLSALLGSIMSVGMLALFILFQQEIRRFLLLLGSRYTLATWEPKWMRRLFGKKSSGMCQKCLNEVSRACSEMAETKTGALIVLARRTSLEPIAKTGDLIDAVVSSRLIKNIFFKNAPLHDGAMLIVSERVMAARCTLPISEDLDIPAQYGMRHRAAVGITEQTDALVIVVSEETGGMSVVQEGKIQKINSQAELRLAIESGMKA